MPAYPSYPQDAESQRKVPDTALIERTGDGSPRVRVLYPDKAEFAVVHALSRAEVAALQSWRTANRGLEVDFHWEEDGTNYTVICVAPIETRRIGWDLVIATVKLVEV